MNESSKINVPVLLGPTAVGKTEMAILVASELGWEILSCDSRQVYRGMNIGTAKPSDAQKRSVSHHLIDIIEPSEEYSAYRFVADSTEVLLARAQEGRTTLICGGTGLYFKSLSEGIGPQIESDPDIRRQLMVRGEKFGTEILHKELTEKDAVAASRIHPNDLQRIVRALAVYYQTGVPLSELQVCKSKPEMFEFSVITLTAERDILYNRINKRVTRMIEDGLFEEFQGLVSQGYHENSPGLQCVGYKELFLYTKNGCSFNEAVELIKRNSRRYAKRQITWFSHQVNSREITPEYGPQDVIALFKQMMNNET